MKKQRYQIGWCSAGAGDSFPEAFVCKEFGRSSRLTNSFETEESSTKGFYKAFPSGAFLVHHVAANCGICSGHLRGSRKNTM